MCNTGEGMSNGQSRELYVTIMSSLCGYIFSNIMQVIVSLTPWNFAVYLAASWLSYYICHWIVTLTKTLLCHTKWVIAISLWMRYCYVTLNKTLLHHTKWNIAISYYMSNYYVKLQKLSLCYIVIAINSKMNNIRVKYSKVFSIFLETLNKFLNGIQL